MRVRVPLVTVLTVTLMAALDGTLAAVTAMYKVAGYAGGAGDWFWLKRNTDGTIEGEGRVPMCQNCHAAQAANDYLFTGSLSGAGVPR